MPIKGSRPIIQMDIEGNFITEFPSVKAAAKQFGGKITDCSKIQYAAVLWYRYKTPSGKEKTIVNKKLTAFGYRWKFKESTN